MSKIKIVYIDKDKWQEEINLFYLTNEINETACHDFVCYNNVVSLEHDSKNTTICTLSNLVTSIYKKITSKHESIVIIGFGITLEYTFLNLLKIAEEKNIDIYILDKSKFPIRSNVSMTIDLNEYDTKTDFNKIQNILEQNLTDSLENAKKSKRPEHANDLGISLTEEKSNSSLTTFFNSLGLENIIGEYELIEEDEESINEEEIDEFIKMLLDNDSNTQKEEDMNIGVKVINNIYEISDEKNTIQLNKKSIKKLFKILEVLLYD